MVRRGKAVVLPEALRTWRRERHLTQLELSTRAGCSEALIATAETGRRNLSLQSVCRIAAALEVPPSAIARLNASDDEIAAAVAEVAA